MSLWLALFVSLSILSVATCATITVSPSPITTTLYTPVDFTCEGYGGDLAWTIDGNPITDTVKQERAITITTNISNGTISSVLTMISLPVNNDTCITCNIGTNVYNLVSLSASLIIRGISPVENVSLDLNSSMLYWLPPSSIPPQYQPLLSYIVNVTGTIGQIDVNTTNTSLKLPSSEICDYVTCIIIVISGNYISNKHTYISNLDHCKLSYIKKYMYACICILYR
jgi:hypothetical protein